MKKFYQTLSVAVLSAFCIFFSGCGKSTLPDYSRVSEIRDKIYAVEGEYFTATCFLESRESPFVSDGKAYDMKKILVVRIKPSSLLTSDCTVSLGDSSAKLIYRAETDAYVATLDADDFDANNSFLLFEALDKKEERPFSDVTPDSLSHEEIYKKFLDVKKKELSEIGEDYEIRLRIVERNQKAFWYVGIVTSEKTICYLTDRNGKIIAEKTTVN